MATEKTSLLASRDGDGSSSTTTLPHHQLVGRRFSRFLAQVIPNYGTHGNLEEAWDYFENIVLPRRMEDGKGGFRKAPVGTAAPTSLYSAWFTPQRDLRDFGTEIAVYFETLRALVVVCFIAWLLYLPSIRYYQSEQYSANQENVGNAALQGSLLCSETEWVPCPTCLESEWKEDPGRFARDLDNPDLIFILRNACAPLRWQEGVNHLVVLVFLIAAIVGLGYHQSKMELSYDEDVLTASDFSICVNNPPQDATDPDEWSKFFSQFDVKIVYCTVALDNEELVAALVKRRGLLQKAGLKVKDRDDDDIPLQEFPASLHNTKLHRKMQEAEAKCLELIKRKYAATTVFVTFETESGQRSVLKKLTVGKISIATNDTSVLEPSLCFRGDLVLDVEEAKEPSVIRWPDLNETLLVRVLQRACTGFITIVLIALGFFAVKRAFRFNLTLAAILIAVLNIAVPNIFKVVNTIESHAREGSYQASLYAKISFFRFFNTAIVTIMIKPFTMTIADDKTALLPAVYAVLKAEIVTAPIVHMLDIVGQIKRLVLAPRAANQAGMNVLFRGSKQNLGEKYTNMTKIIFLCFFYSVIFPSSFFFGALAIAATYVSDKFLLLRSWGPMAELGDDVAKLSRRFFFPLTLVVLAIVSEFYWSAYPFDDACEADQVVGSSTYPEYIGSHRLAALSPRSTAHKSIKITLSGDGTEKVYRFCDEDYIERVSALLHFFTAEKDDWMSPDQQVLTFLFGIFCVAVLVIIGIVALVRDIWPDLRGSFQGEFTTLERDSGERFSEQQHIQAYVPQVPHRLFAHPLLACDIDVVEPRHIGWTDPLHSHKYYNLHNDVDYLLKRERLQLPGPVLNPIGHWDKT